MALPSALDELKRLDSLEAAEAETAPPTELPSAFDALSSLDTIEAGQEPRSGFGEFFGQVGRDLRSVAAAINVSSGRPDPVAFEDFRGRFLNPIAALSREVSDISAINRDIDRLLGVEPAPFKQTDPAAREAALGDPEAVGPIPLSPEEQRFQNLPVPVQAASAIARAGARFATGTAGFITGLPSFLDPEALAPEGTEDPAGAVLAQEFQGLRDLIGGVLPAADFRIQKLFGVDDPSATVDPSAPISRLYQAITGREMTPEEFQRVVNQVISEAPEAPLFGAAIVSGAVRGAAKLGRKTGAVAKKPLSVQEQITEGLRRELEPAEPTISAEAEIQRSTADLLEKRVREPERAPTERIPAEERRGTVLLEPERATAEQLGRAPTKPIQKPFKAPPQEIKAPIAKAPPEGQPIKLREPTAAELPTDRVTGLSKLEQDRFRERVDLPELSPVERRSRVKVFNEAKESKLADKAIDIADDIINSKRPITDAEHSGMVLRSAVLENEYDILRAEVANQRKKGNLIEAEAEHSRSEIILDKIDRITEGARIGRREAARALGIGGAKISRDNYNLVSVMQRARSSKGDKLSVEQTARFEKLVAENKALKAEVEPLQLQHEKAVAENERLLAEAITNRVSRRAKISDATASKKKTLLAERVEIKKAIADLGFRLNDITGVTVEGSYLIGRLAVNYIREGALTLEAVVKRVLTDLPDLTERDVYKALIERDPKIQKRAKTDVSKRIVRLRTQARLLLKIEKAEKGIFEKPKPRQPQPAEIRSLRRTLTDLKVEAYRSGLDNTRIEKALATINELQDQLANAHRTIKKRKPVETAELLSAKAKIRELRRLMRVEDELANLNEQLRTGVFEVRQKPEPLKVSPELARKESELGQSRRQIRGQIELLAPFTLVRTLIEVGNTIRTVKTSGDLSALFRQGWFIGARRPDIFFGAFAKGFKPTFSDLKAEQIDFGIRSAPHHYKRENAGLFLSERDGSLSKSEELFSARLIKRVPGLGAIVRGSERNFVTVLNLLRVGAFDWFLNKYPNASDATLKGWANWVNIGTGRGNLGRASAIGTGLATFLFAPRFAWSRIQAPTVLFRNLSDPILRKEIAKDYAAITGTGLLFLAIADAAGFKVGTNPDDPDFLKARVGNTRIDIWSGTLQPTRLFIRTALVPAKKFDFPFAEVPFGLGRVIKPEQLNDPLEMFLRFASYKASPLVSVPLEFARGKTIVGEETIPSETALRALTFLILEDVHDAFRDAGFGAAALTAPLVGVGVGVQTFEDSRFRTRKNIEKFVRDEDYTNAHELQFQWNMKHPDKPLNVPLDKVALQISKEKKTRDKELKERKEKILEAARRKGGKK